MRNFFMAIFPHVFAPFLLILTIFIPAIFLNWFICSQKANQMGLECKYSPFTGCMINPKGKWVPLESYRVI